MLNNPVRQFRNPSIQGSRFRMQVIDNNDPLRNQRVKARHPELHAGVPDSDLPWITREGGGFRNVSIPSVGDQIIVIATDESDDNMVYVGNPNFSNNQMSEILNQNYPHVYGHIDEANNLIMVNTSTNTMTIAHNSGTTITIDGSGNITMSSANDATINVNGEAIISVSGNAKISAGGNLDLAAGTINLNTSGPDAPASTTSRGAGSIPNTGFI